MTPSPDLAELARKIQRLEDIEAIKRLKYQYFRCFDTANLAELAEVFTDDVTLSVVGGVYRFTLHGKQAYLAMARDGAHAEMVTQHNGHHPEIDVLGESEATGIWYLHDFVLEFRRKQQITVAALAERHVARADARRLYEDLTPPLSPEEIETRRLERLFRAAITPPRAPDKRQRRALRKMKGKEE